jgi:hypothetical protein
MTLSDPTTSNFIITFTYSSSCSCYTPNIINPISLPLSNNTTTMSSAENS